MKQCELKFDGMEELKEQEMLALSGGGFLKSITPWAILSSMIENWQDIREGFSDGFSGRGPRY